MIRAGHFDRLLAFLTEHRLPHMFGNVESARAGGLMGMAVNLDASWRIVARQIDRILKGASPGEIPVEENLVHDVVLNRSMARKIGLTFPQSVLLQATEVVD